MSSCVSPNFVLPLVCIIELLTNSVWNSWAVMFPVAVTLLNVTLLVEPNPWILPEPAKILPVDVLVVIFVLNEPLSVFNAEILEVAAVILVENEPLSVFKLETLVENEPLSLVKELPVPSFLATLIEKLALDSVIEPLVSSLATRDENEPLSLVKELPVPSFLAILIENELEA